MILTENIQIPDSEFEFTFARSGGPGGQNVNKVASKAVLHWDFAGNATLPADVKDRFRQRYGGRLTTEGVVVLDSQLFRDQAKNVADCLKKLREMLMRALVAPKKRKPTRPSRASRERRLQAKRHTATQKAHRRKPGGDE